MKELLIIAFVGLAAVFITVMGALLIAMFLPGRRSAALRLYCARYARFFARYDVNPQLAVERALLDLGRTAQAKAAHKRAEQLAGRSLKSGKWVIGG